MFSKHKIGLAIIDVTCITAGFLFGFWYVFASGLYHEPGAYPIYFIPSIFLALVIFLSVFQLSGLYKYQAIVNPIHQIQYILQSYGKVLGLFIVIIFFSKTRYFADSRLAIGLSFLSSFILTVFFRVVITPKIYFFLVSKEKFRKRTLIVGAGEHGIMVCRYLKFNHRSYFKVIGFCDDDFNKVGKVIEGFPVFGTSYELESLITKHSIREIIIAISNVKKEEMLDLIERCKNAGLVIHIVSDLYTEVNDKMKAEEFGGLRTYRIVPQHNGILRIVAKRLFNVVGSGIFLILFSPIFLVIAYAIKRDSKGPVFYKRNVIGKDGKPFLAYKFRSMYHNDTSNTISQSNQKTATACDGKKNHTEFMKNFIQGTEKGKFYVKNENRITNVGCFLRKYSLDELPQLINVFRGEMNLVGPRFCTLTEYKFYKSWHKKRFRVKPGMTGLWQVRARSAVSYDDMVMLDLYYIENQSPLFDLEILLRTIPVVLYGKGSRIEKEKEKSLSEKLQEMMGSKGKQGIK